MSEENQARLLVACADKLEKHAARAISNCASARRAERGFWGRILANWHMRWAIGDLDRIAQCAAILRMVASGGATADEIESALRAVGR
ncbi:amidase family protein [Burkholderiales bacterium GJ-E10]|nr:amidase family protein [Burkholderiales bacterium GJ-E10]